MTILSRRRLAPFWALGCAVAAIAGAFLLLWGAILLASRPAGAQEGETPTWALQRYRYCGARAWDGSCTYWRYGQRHVQVYRRHHHTYRPPVYGYVQRDYDIDRRDSRSLCRHEVTTALSDQHKTEERSRADAIRKWMAAVQHDGGGGEFMDFDAARHVEWRCGPSDPHDSFTGRWSQRLAKSVAPGGSDTEGRNIRCRVWARPCRSAREQDRDGRRDR